MATNYFASNQQLESRATWTSSLAYCCTKVWEATRKPTERRSERHCKFCWTSVTCCNVTDVVSTEWMQKQTRNLRSVPNSSPTGGFRALLGRLYSDFIKLTIGMNGRRVTRTDVSQHSSATDWCARNTQAVLVPVCSIPAADCFRHLNVWRQCRNAGQRFYVTANL